MANPYSRLNSPPESSYKTLIMSRKVLYYIMMRAKILVLSLILLLVPLSGIEKSNFINSWQELFTEPFEIIYIIMKDNKVFKHSNQDEIKVYMDSGRLEEALKNFKTKSYSIKNIAIIIHNHLKGCRFSDEDHKQYRSLKEYGFNGFFLVYCHTSNKVYDIEDGAK